MVIFIKLNEMEEDGRRGKRVGIWRRMFKGNSPAVQQSNSSPGPTSPPRERRPLRSVPAIGPHYKVDPEVLAKEYVEKECKYIGTIADVNQDFDPGNRAMILSLLDEKKKLGHLVSRLSWQQDVVVSFSVYNVKVLWRDGEDLIHRIPTHRIAAAGFVQDDSQIYLFFKFASEVNDRMCNMAFFNCENKAAAQEVCFLTQQLFQLAYTNSTMDFFDKSIQDGALTPKHNSFSTDDSTDKKDTIKLSLNLEPSRNSTNGSIDVPLLLHNGHRTSPAINKASTLPLSSTPQRQSPRFTRAITLSTPSSPISSRPRWRSESSASSSLTTPHPNHQQLQLNEYIEVLKERLTKEELQRFAEHLHHFRNGTLSIAIYCERLMTIYTEQRKSLLLGMRHFIPEPKDRSYFEAFLRRHSIETGSDDVRWWDRPPKPRTLSETDGSCASTTLHTNELSSNSDHMSPHQTSNEDSGEGEEVVSGATNSRQKKSTWKKSIIENPTAPSKLEHGPPRRLYINLDDDGSPLVRSGRDIVEGTVPDVPERTVEQQSKKKKSRGKSPSAVEFGAPIPSFATGGTDEDLDSSLDKKSKRTAKLKKKEKGVRTNEDEISKISASTKDAEPTPKSPNEGDASSRKFFKARTTKVKEKIDNSLPSAPPDPLIDTALESSSNPSSKPLKKEHRKKRKHKFPADVRPSTSATFL